ncbi:MAG: hypothetical protein ACJAZ9_000391 [Neolewinella sp.]|jgi:hypothetical protein
MPYLFEDTFFVGAANEVGVYAEHVRLRSVESGAEVQVQWMFMGLVMPTFMPTPHLSALRSMRTVS